MKFVKSVDVFIYFMEVDLLFRGHHWDGHTKLVGLLGKTYRV